MPLTNNRVGRVTPCAPSLVRQTAARTCRDGARARRVGRASPLPAERVGLQPAVCHVDNLKGCEKVAGGCERPAATVREHGWSDTPGFGNNISSTLKGCKSRTINASATPSGSADFCARTGGFRWRSNPPATFWQTFGLQQTGIVRQKHPLKFYRKQCYIFVSNPHPLAHCSPAKTAEH